MSSVADLRLQTRIGLVLTGLAASLLLVLGGLWLHGARQGIGEEVEAASRVSFQMLKTLSSLPAARSADGLIAIVRPLGRVRANELTVRAADGEVLYRSPAPTYKAGRQVPTWFAQLLAPTLAPRSLPVGDLQLVLQPDASRSLLDAWDDLCAMAGWALGLLALLFVATRRALDRALQPLARLVEALDRTGAGCLDTRLPAFSTPELARLSHAFNGMADRLSAAIDENVRLETEREVGERLQARLHEERRFIARELHDELAQGITAVRALAGAIVQRSGELPALAMPAQSIVEVTGDMQQGVRNILHRLRPEGGGLLAPALEQLLAGWRRQHAEIVLHARLALGPAPLDARLAQAVLRIVQEGLTNIVRHAGASQAELLIDRRDGALRILLSDNGRGLSGRPSAAAGCGLGLAGMAERVADLGGQLDFSQPTGGGFQLRACLPETSTMEVLS